MSDTTTSKTKEISVVQGLTELKTLDKRIEKLGQTISFTALKKGNNTKVNGHKEIAKFEEDLKKSFQQYNDLVSYRDKIKASIVASNALTEVTVADETMTVAEAIEKKTSIKYQKQLLNKMKSDFTMSVNQINNENSRMQTEIDNIVKVQEKSNMSKDLISNITDDYKKNNQSTLVDPLSVEDKIKELDLKISDFETNVDVVLSESNALTKISVPNNK